MRFHILIKDSLKYKPAFCLIPLAPPTTAPNSITMFTIFHTGLTTVFCVRIKIALCLYPQKWGTACPLRFLVFSDFRISRSGTEVVSYTILLLGFAKMGKCRRQCLKIGLGDVTGKKYTWMFHILWCRVHGNNFPVVILNAIGVDFPPPPWYAPQF